MIIQYVSPEDKLGAELIQKALGGTVYRGYIDPNALNDSVILVGGQVANSMYQQFVNLGVLPEIFIGDPGKVFVASYRGYRVYACAGAERSNTMAAAEWIFLNGLPASTTIAGDVGELYFGKIILKEMIPGAFNGIISNYSRFMAYIGNHLPTGYHIDYTGLNGNILEVLIRKERGALSLFEPTITFIVLVILALVSLAVAIYVVGVTFQKIVSGTVETVAKKNASNILDEKFKNGEITYDEYIKGVRMLWGSVDWKNILLWALLIGAIGVGGYYLAKGLIPKLTK